MKFYVDQSAFLNALQIALQAVPSKSTLQILNNFLLNLEGSSLQITSTDLDMGIQIRLDVRGEVDGSIVVNARKLYEMVKEQGDSEIEFSVDNFLVLISAGHFSANMSGNDPVEFPNIEDVDTEQSITMNVGELQYLSENTLFAVSNDSTRPSLGGVYCEQDDNQLIFVATDGHRLGKAFIEFQGGSIPNSAIIPPKILGNVLRFLDGNAQVDIAMGERHICFSSDRLKVVSKLIEGPYPKYQNVIPNQFEKEVILQRQEALSVLRRVATMANQKNRQIKLEFQDDKLEVSAENQEIGSSCKEPLAAQYAGEAGFKIAFNANFLIDILKMCPSEQVKIKMNSPLGACVIHPVGEGMDFYFLLMPLRFYED